MGRRAAAALAEVAAVGFVCPGARRPREAAVPADTTTRQHRGRAASPGQDESGADG